MKVVYEPAFLFGEMLIGSRVYVAAQPENARNIGEEKVMKKYKKFIPRGGL